MRKTVAQFLLLPVILFLGIGVNYAVSQWQIHKSESQWCNLVDILTAGSMPKPHASANQETIRAYAVYTAIVQRKKELGCKSHG